MQPNRSGPDGWRRRIWARSPTKTWVDSLLIEPVNPRPWQRFLTWAGLLLMANSLGLITYLVGPSRLTNVPLTVALVVGVHAWFWYAFFYQSARFDCDWQLRDPDTFEVVGHIKWG
jgi:hypothetical protein